MVVARQASYLEVELDATSRRSSRLLCAAGRTIVGEAVRGRSRGGGY